MDHLTHLIERYPALAQMRGAIEQAYRLLEECYEKGGKLLVCGNGGSAADSDHIVGELMKGFYKQRMLPTEERKRFGEQGEKLQGMKVITMTGRNGGKLKELSDVCMIVPAQVTADIQEYHLPVYHTLCAMLEEHFFPDA